MDESLQVGGAGVQLATEVQGLLALPAATAAGAPALAYASLIATCHL